MVRRSKKKGIRHFLLFVCVHSCVTVTLRSQLLKSKVFLQTTLKPVKWKLAQKGLVILHKTMGIIGPDVNRRAICQLFEV